jgi:hypothetical protein
MSDGRDRIKAAFDGWGATKRKPSKDRERFETLTIEANERGVRWQDLTLDGYQAPGDLRMGGLHVRYDWGWRADELQRRIDVHAGRDGT